VIIDNCSDEPVEKMLKAEFGERLDTRVRLLRNPVNTGLGGNVCRCFECAEGEWMWLLGDDDAVCAHAVAEFLDKIRNCGKHIGFINFSTPFQSYKKDFELKGTGDLWAFCQSPNAARYFVSNLVYISVGCYRMDIFGSLLRQGYAMASSHCPHFAMILSMLLESSGTVLLAPQLPVRWDEQKSGLDWNGTKVMAGSMLLAELDKADSHVIRIVSKLVGEFRHTRFPKAMLLLIFGDLSRPWQYWALFLARILILGGWKLKIEALALLACLPLAMNASARGLLHRMIRNRSGTDSTKGDERL
jgi:hypothetical protein